MELRGGIQHIPPILQMQGPGPREGRRWCKNTPSARSPGIRRDSLPRCCWAPSTVRGQHEPPPLPPESFPLCRSPSPSFIPSWTSLCFCATLLSPSSPATLAVPLPTSPLAPRALSVWGAGRGYGWVQSNNSLPNGHTHKCRKTQPHTGSQADTSQSGRP